jgi:primosomal protein N' (replication factor Y)
VVRVRQDLPAVDRAFDYLVPTADSARVGVGTIVRVPLHGRRVRGWVVAADVEPETERSRLLELSKVVGAGPPPGIMDLARWAAHRWAGSDVALYGAASPPNVVAEPDPGPEDIRSDAHLLRVVAWPPAADRRALVDAALATEGSSIVVVPDAARLGSLVRHLERSGRRVHVLHSVRSAAERTRAWAASRHGRAVVVGGRSAVWAPVPDLGAIVVLDEADEALQEERAPTWHARDVAIERARRAGVPCTLVAAIPTAVATSAVLEVERPERDVERAGWAHLEVVDLREEPPGQALLSASLARAAHRTLDAGGRVLCVLNRKGRARLIACGACHDLARCEACGAAVSEIAGPDGARALGCAVCSLERPWVCARCHSAKLKSVRVGVNRVRDDLAALLPRASVLDVDATTEGPLDADVLVGTEAVLHRAPTDRPIGLVAFLEADQELLAPRYRAAEQAGTLFARAVRRLGARAAGGVLLVQTRVPEHEVLRAIAAADPAIAWEAEAVRRRVTGYPPFGALARVRGERDAVAAVVDALRPDATLAVLGPVEVGAAHEALVRAANPESLADALAPVLPAARALGRLRVEVDPPRV